MTRHFAKTCPTTANAEAGADITGFEGQQFVSGSFTLASTSQCYGGAPRFTILMTSGKIFFVSCNLVTPRINPDGTATYVFNASTLPAEFVPVGTIKQVDIALDVQGASDITRIFFNGVRQLPAGTGPLSKAECKNGGWKTFADPKFKNQGQCIAFFNHHNGRGKDDTKTSGGHPKSGHGH